MRISDNDMMNMYSKEKNTIETNAQSLYTYNRVQS
jgi:hypothetical protein